MHRSKVMNCFSLYLSSRLGLGEGEVPYQSWFLDRKGLA